MPVEGRGLSSRQPQQAAKDREIGQLNNSETCSEAADGVARESEGGSQLSLLRPVLEPSEQAKAAIGKRVTVVDYPDGRLAIRYKGIELAYRTFDKIQQVDQGAIVENNGSAPRSPSSARSSFAVDRNGAARKHRAGAISATRVCLKSAEPFHKPSGPSPLG